MERSDGWFLAIVGVAIGFICGIAWVDVGMPPNWVATYQTLITGVLAVGAAAFTVNAMHRSDDRQKELTLRDARRAAKNAVWVGAYFNNIYVELENVSDYFRRKYLGSSSPPLSSDDFAKNRAFRANLKTGMELEVLLAASKNFGTSMSGTYEVLKVLVQKADLLVRMGEKALKPATVDPIASKNLATRFISAVEDSKPVLKTFSEGLARLEGEI
ncbi:hypothetical protein [Mesorhizobium sp.]|uniref:hypothetical protein n=1 Tax=Mesorhizobium sp. TaxID=1871066 RepID=UPI000FE67E93|nr:hypothetical protein [Mesorhizobium sp.]RWA99724.1 MAG: hypothetical protein EOQ33_23120 [Mesorhizobium sp.]